MRMCITMDSDEIMYALSICCGVMVIVLTPLFWPSSVF